MKIPWNEERRRLLDRLQQVGGAGRAEFEPEDRLAPGFFPVAEHLRMLDPEVVLVVGPRGAGKTEMVRVLTEKKLASSLARFAPAVRLPQRQTAWHPGHPLEREGFDIGGLRSFLAGPGETVERMREVWFTYLIRVLGPQVDSEAQRELGPLLARPGGDLERNYREFQRSGREPLLALDRLDKRLERSGDYLFVSYDELDTLGGGDSHLMEESIRGLVAFWAGYARRWRHIRAKIFLRTDLFDRHATVGGADLAKLAAGRVELAWNDRDLYAMLIKRLANASDDLYQYCLAAKSKVEWESDSDLGRIPKLSSWMDARPIVERMVGQYMGANRKKGLVFRWLLDHVRDGHGLALPRPFVRLIEEGAYIELKNQDAVSSPRLLTPSSLRRALDRVSLEHVKHAEDEWPWLPSVKQRLMTNQLVPWERDRELIKQLEDFPDEEDERKSPPFKGRDLLEYLIEVGILRRRPDQRIDAPDLFLSGLGLKRKGGVRRK